MKKAMITVGVAALLLTGCGGGVELSEEDTVRVAQYAADLVLKYDSNYKERLLTLEEQEEAKEKLRQAAEREAKLQELLEQKNNVKTESDSEKKETGDSNENGESAQQEEPVVMYALNDAVKVEGFSFKDNGYEIVDKYPEVSGENETVSMELSATTGKKLLLVKYVVTNTTDTKTECNLFDKNISAQVTVNGSVEADSMVTMLLNDFSTLKTEIEPGASYEAVLVFEIPEEAANITTLGMSLTVDGNTYNIQQ